MWAILYPSGTVTKDGVVQTSLTEYVAFLESGGTPEALQDAPDPYPRIEVSAWQFAQAVVDFGWLDAVESAVAASDNPKVRLGWERASAWRSDHPLTLAVAASIGKSRDEVQSLFTHASGLS